MNTFQNQNGDFLRNSETVLLTVCENFQIIIPAKLHLHSCMQNGLNNDEYLPFVAMLDLE